MQRRHFARQLAALAAVAATMGLGTATQAAEPEAPLVTAPKIIEALTSKDIVLDRPGQAAPASGAPRRDPSINLHVKFTFDSAQLLPQGKRQLDELAMALSHKALSTWGFLLAGHTDKVGDADYNLRLSLARADAVKAYLAEAHGIAPRRLQTIGYGFSRLTDPANPAAAVNRRVEVRRIALAQGGGATSSPATGGRLVPTPR